MHTIEVNGAQIAYLQAGSPTDPLALCLHGFPDTANTWRYLVPSLVDAGWHVVCPNLRGFAPTQAPMNGPAGADILGSDANALHQALGGDERAVIIGHDWGAAAAYAAVVAAPERWSKIIASAWPPVPSNVDLISYEQMRRSWYVFLFQLEVAEAVVRDDDFSLLDLLWKDWAASGYDRMEDVARAKDALSDPDCLRLALAHYRTLFAEHVSMNVPSISMLYIHGEHDGCIGKEIIERFSLDTLSSRNSKVIMLPDAGHFPHLEQPHVFNAEVVKALTAQDCH
jgi:pimeloyl-ACP methyl ester carboxylesterase